LGIPQEAAEAVLHRKLSSQNSRKGGCEGSLIKDINRYMKQGLSLEHTIEVLMPELSAALRDYFPQYVDPAKFKNLKAK